MTKGISRHIIEVTGDNPYFERALFVVRPAYADGDEETLRRSAERELARASTFSAMKRRAVWRRVAWGAALLLSAALGAGLTLLWMWRP